MGRWLAKIQKSTGQYPPQTPRIPLGGLRGEESGAFEEKIPVHQAPTELSKPAPAPVAEIDTILDTLANEVGRDLGLELKRQIRRTMAPMSRKARAELAAVIDDSFEDTESVQEGRDKALELLSEASPTEE